MSGYGTMAQWQRRVNRRDGYAEFHVLPLDDADDVEDVEEAFDAWCDLHMPHPTEKRERTVAEVTRDTAHG